MKTQYSITIHRDGTATIWNVYHQVWERHTITSLLIEKHDILASLSQKERDALNRKFNKLV